MADNEYTSLSDYPTYMNGTEIPFFPEIDNTPQNIDKTNQSEGGSDIVQRIRVNKTSQAVSMTIADAYWVKFFYELFLMDSFVFKQYSPLVDGYVEKTVRITNFRYKAKRRSEYLTEVKGVWEVSFNIEEF